MRRSTLAGGALKGTLAAPRYGHRAVAEWLVGAGCHRAAP